MTDNEIRVQAIAAAAIFTAGRTVYSVQETIKAAYEFEKYIRTGELPQEYRSW